jgi:ABC-type transporter MlaC component
MYNFTFKLITLMKFIAYLSCFFLMSVVGHAQVDKNNPQQMGYVLTEKDSILSDTIELPEIIISKEKLDPEAQKQFLILQNRVYKTYPFARLASDRLVALNKGMARMTSNREKKKYFKIVEDYLNNEFEGKLKKLSRKQGQILVKLIHRQTGTTTYELVKTLKSGWKAFWANTTANVFDISLKTEYAPYEVNEDYLIETILVRAFESGRLQYQAPAKAVDYDDLSNRWQEKAKELKGAK